MKEKTVQIKDYVFVLRGDSATVTGWNKTRKSVELPNVVENLPVCDIAPKAFEGCSELRDLSLPFRMEHLPFPELKELKSLENIHVSPLHDEFSSRDGVLYNKEQTVLIDCPVGRKKPLTVPDTVRKIGRSALRGCDQLPAVTLPESVEVIEELAFHGCRRLRTLSLPESLRHIGRHAVSACRQLREIHFSASVTEAPLLHGCRALRAITVTPGNPALSSRSGVLYNADATELLRCPQGKTGRLTLPAETVSVGEGFSGLAGCGELTEIRVMPGNPAFCDLDGVLMSADRSALICCPAGHGGTLSLPAETVTLAPDAFPTQILPIVLADDNRTQSFWIEESALNAIEVSPENPVFSSENGVLYNKERTVLLRCPGGYEGALEVPGGVTALADAALRGCSALTGLNLPESLRKIGYAALEGCFRLETLTVPPLVEAIGQDALVGCVNLKTLTVTGAETAIAPLAADCCDQLTICAPTGSPAAQYAKEEGIPFQPL